MEKKKKITIGIAIAVVVITAVIVGITVNNHQKAVKEAESISISVQVSKTDLITYYKKQYDEITSKNYSTEEDYTSAKALLESLKNDINNSDVKDDKNIVNLINNIDTSINDYNEKIKALTTTEEFETKTEEATACPITEKLIKAGYQQTRGGYIQKAIKNNMEMNYKKAVPTQYWHLFESYFNSNSITDDTVFTKRVVCGELIFWMAEVLDCVEKSELQSLCDKIIKNPIPGEENQRYNKNRQPIIAEENGIRQYKIYALTKLQQQ